MFQKQELKKWQIHDNEGKILGVFKKEKIVLLLGCKKYY